MKLPAPVRYILQTLHTAGYAAYVVGGCVRDRLMGKTPKDWDITTDALPADVQRLFLRTVATGLRHGTVTVLVDTLHGLLSCEVTTFRIDGEYTDGRRPDRVAFTTTLDADLARRDFTMNAVAYNEAEGLVDPFGGTEDIRNRIIRCVGEPTRRFDEDALRMLRAVRFAAQTGFVAEPATLAAIPPLAPRLGLVSAERIRDELTKIVFAPDPSPLLWLADLRVWEVLFPDWPPPSPEVIPELVRLSALIHDPAPLYAALFRDAESAVRRLKFDNATIRDCALYAAWRDVPLPLEAYAFKKALGVFGVARFQKLLLLKNIEGDALLQEVLASGECYRVADLAVDGHDLLAAGVPAGVALGDTLARLLEYVLQNPERNRKADLLSLLF